MDKEEFKKIRHTLGKTQVQMGRLLGVSVKAVQSFEQGWRNIPIHVERQLLFLLYLQLNLKTQKPCWIQKDCPEGNRSQCPTWQFKAKNLCWFINGTFCDGELHESWQEKISVCRKCDVFKQAFNQSMQSRMTTTAPNG